ncbi:hypothetical protein C8R45DRAFT_1220079 [Mycena sanguinolenta]|nr:hypothetical protein C8R45DRAFT_1220079 [Mycena sanguinolenta]
MRFTVSLPALVLAAATAAFAAKCAICPNTLPPGVSEIAWSLVWSRDVAVNQMFCGYQGKGRGNPNPVQTFCMFYDNNGTRIENDQSWHLCPNTAKVTNCNT